MTPGADIGALELDHYLGLDRLVEADLLQIDVLEAAAHRMQLLLLDHDRNGFAALDLEVEERCAFAEHVADLAFGRLKGARLGAAAVDDTRHQALTPQATGGAGAEIAARVQP